MVTNHGIGLTVGELHDWHVLVMLVSLEERFDVLVGFLLVDYGLQRVQSPESIPQRKCGVVNEIIGFVHLFVNAAISAVNIHVDIGMYHSVVHSCVKNSLLFSSASFHLNLAKLFVPNLFGFIHNLLKVPAGNFSIQVFPCSFNAYGGDACFQQHSPVFPGIKTEKCLNIPSLCCLKVFLHSIIYCNPKLFERF